MGLLFLIYYSTFSFTLNVRLVTHTSILNTTFPSHFSFKCIVLFLWYFLATLLTFEYAHFVATNPPFNCCISHATPWLSHTTPPPHYIVIIHDVASHICSFLLHHQKSWHNPTTCDSLLCFMSSPRVIPLLPLLLYTSR